MHLYFRCVFLLQTFFDSALLCFRLFFCTVPVDVRQPPRDIQACAVFGLFCCFVYSFDCLQGSASSCPSPPHEGTLSGAGRVWFPAWPAIYRLLFLHKRILFSSASQGRRFPNQFGTGSPALSRAIITRPGLAAHTKGEERSPCRAVASMALTNMTTVEIKNPKNHLGPREGMNSRHPPRPAVPCRESNPEPFGAGRRRCD